MTDRENEPNHHPVRRTSAIGRLECSDSAEPASQAMPPKRTGAGLPDEAGLVVGPRFAPEITEDLLTGSRALRRALREAPTGFATSNATLVRLDQRNAPVILIRGGFAYRSSVLDDGKRAILDVLVPGDIVGLDHVLLARPASEIIAANRVTYNELDPARLRTLMADPCIALSVMALLAEARWRSDRLSATIGRLDAEARLAALVLSIHDRLRGRGLINHLSFNLPLTQEQIADHLGLTLVHVNRTLRRMREERLVLMDRQVVMIMNLEGLRTLTRGLPETAAQGPASALMSRQNDR